MSGTSRVSARSTASGRIKTENPALVKLLTSDSLTDTRFVAAEHTSPVHTPHASTNVKSNSTATPENSVKNRPNSRFSEKGDKENRPDSRYSEKNNSEQAKTDNRPESRYSLKNSPVKLDIDNRADSRFSQTSNSEKQPDSRYSAKSDKVEKQKENSNNSSWGNVEESLTFDVDNIKSPDFDQTSPKSNSPTKKEVENILNTDSENNLEIQNTDRLPSSESIKPQENISGKNTPSKIDYLKIDRVESPLFEKSPSREQNKTPSGVSYSSSRLKNISTSSSQQHPFLEARSVSELPFAQGGEGIEADSLDVDSGLVPDTTSYLQSAPDSGRQTYRVPSPVTKHVPVITSAESSRFRANSRTSQRTASVTSATGVPAPQFDRNESVVSDNGIPPPSNINYDLASNDIEDVNQDNLSEIKKFDQRKSAVSFKEPVISDYHSHTEGRGTEDWDTPRERVPTPHPATPQKFQDSLDFNSGRTSNLSPDHTHQFESDIPSVSLSQTIRSGSARADQNNSAKSGSGRAVKKIYIDSPTFTREEEDEFRFVESRIDDMNEDLEDQVRRIEEQGNRYKQEREAMNEEAARLRAEIQATEGYSNSYNSRNTSDRYGQSDQMDSRSYGRSQDQDSGYRQERNQNGYSNNSNGYGNVRDSRDVHNARNDNRYEDRNVDDQEGYSRNPGGYSQEPEGYSRNQGGYAQNQTGYARNQGGQGRESEGYSQNQGGYARDQDRHSREQDGYSQEQERNSRRQNDQYSRRQDDQYDRQQDDQYSRRQDDQQSRRQDDQYSRRPNDQESQRPDDQYSRRQDDQYYDRRGASPSRYRNGDERGDDDLQRETEYQEDLRHRLENNQIHDSEVVIPRIPLDEQYRDSLDENGYNDQRNFARDSLDQEGYGNWGNPPPNPFGQGRGENEKYLSQREEKPEYEEDMDTARMELLHPKEPRVDYVEENKFTYGLPPSKSYKTLKEKEKEAESKLSDIFIHPKKQGKKHKRTIPLPNEEKRPPLTELRGNADQGAEGVWAKRSAQLAKHKDGKTTTSGSVKKSRGLQKYPSDGHLQTTSQGQIQQGQGRMYGTPTRNQYLEPLGYKPQVSREEPTQSPVYRDTGSYKKPIELKPIKTEIMTDDGQKISVDINLKVLSPTFQRRVKSHPDDAPGSEPPFNVQAEVRQKQTGDRRAVGVQYQPSNRGGGGDQTESRYQSPPSDNHSHQSPISQGSRQYPADNQYNRQYQDQPPPQQPLQTEAYRGNDYDGIDEEALLKQEEALMAELNLSPNPYAKIPPIPIRDELTVPVIVEKGGYASMYQENKQKDQNQEPWYQVYTVRDFKKMQKEVRLNRGTLGPDLDNETYKDKLEKRHKQFEYARMVMEKNKHDLHDKKPTNKYPRKDPQVEESEKSKRKAALDYAKNVPRPAVKARPTQYNSYEVASQLSPIVKAGSTGSKSPTHSTQNVDVVDLKKLQQRHEQEKKNIAMMRSNMESVPQKA
ncbi:zinc finger CCCH domain-containing protein 13-like isoform X7 [Mytilus edulis]|uniref:zinc finger CCCH domain-containing protein 13-like isoform X7 n=1 Tax=Mytilus edulis TaxID=6550 RepID=UPI0039F12E48